MGVLESTPGMCTGARRTSEDGSADGSEPLCCTKEAQVTSCGGGAGQGIIGKGTVGQRVEGQGIMGQETLGQRSYALLCASVAQGKALRRRMSYFVSFEVFRPICS